MTKHWTVGASLMLICHTVRWTIAGLTLFFVTMVLSADPAAGGLFRVEGGLTFSFESRGAYIGSSPDAAGISRDVIYDYIAPTSIVPGYHIESAAEAGIAGLSSRAFGEISQSAPRHGLGQGTLWVQATSLAVGRYDDVVVSGPAGSVTTSVNMSLHGFVSLAAPITTSLGHTLAQGRAEVSFYVNESYVGGGFQENELRYQGGAIMPSLDASGVLNLWHGSGTITSPEFTVPANEPFTLEVRLRTSIYAAGYTGETFNSSAIAGFGDTLKFVSGDAVFNVTDGYTANSLDAGIVDNSYTIPEPSSFLLSATTLFSVVAAMAVQSSKS